MLELQHSDVKCTNERPNISIANPVSCKRLLLRRHSKMSKSIDLQSTVLLLLPSGRHALDLLAENKRLVQNINIAILQAWLPALQSSCTLRTYFELQTMRKYNLARHLLAKTHQTERGLKEKSRSLCSICTTFQRIWTKAFSVDVELATLSNY